MMNHHQEREEEREEEIKNILILRSPNQSEKIKKKTLIVAAT